MVLTPGLCLLSLRLRWVGLCVVQKLCETLSSLSSQNLLHCHLLCSSAQVAGAGAVDVVSDTMLHLTDLSLHANVTSGNVVVGYVSASEQRV